MIDAESITGIENVRKTVEILGGMYRHRQAKPTLKSEELYYKYSAEYNDRIARAKNEGKFLVGHTVFAPVEIFFAMDIVPMHLESTSGTITILMNRYQEHLDAARAFGLTPECCSAHRILAATFYLKALPRPDFLVWTSQACDNTTKSGDTLMDLYDIPGFFLDRPYRFIENQVDYYARQMRDLVAFLEERTGKKLDLDRLREILGHSLDMMNLYHEMYELRKAIPAPMRNRSFMNQMIIEWTYCGTPQGTKWFETARDEIQENVNAGRGTADKERYRLLSLFLPPMFENKLLDWMEREYGAVIAMDPMSSWPHPIDIDISDPIKGVAQLSFYRSASRLLHGPGDEFICDAILNAREFQVDAALYFAHIGCRQACALIKPVKDALMKMGIPTGVIDIDLMDPSFTSTDQIKEKLEEFFERLEESS
jgi:benzoyl-CoA reductase/2-hydroxyglutaryl-CoA dehydratase subunit BcrC/BadD/HgdB